MKGELLNEAIAKRLEEARSTYKLNLGYCNIETLPDDFVSLIKKHNPHVIELDLTSNQLTELPQDLHELTHLQALRVKYNRLEVVPPVCFKIQHCVTLDLAGNHIEAIPDDIIRLSALRELDVSGNHITSLTGRLDQLPHLTALHLENNQLQALPESIGFCQGLVKLKCSTNLLRSLPTTMGNLKKIQRLDFANNLIHSVPPVMGHLKALKEFTLRYNPLESAYQQATDEGLSKFLAFLKKEEAREEAETRERLRPIGTQVGHFCEFRCKPLQPGAKPGAPGAPAAPVIEHGDIDHKPWTRTGATLCKLNDTFYLFGGVITKTGRKTAELYVISTDTMEWKLQEATGDSVPVARSDHCAVIDPETNRLIIFGGRSQEKKRMNDVWALDLTTFKWFKQACQGTAPRPRDKASAAVCAGVMVIFGGHTQGKRLNDLCVLDLSSFSWSSWTSVMGQPSPRESAALCVGHGNLLFLHGGASNFGLDDLWVYDQKQQAWLEVITEGLKPPARRSHTLYVQGNTMYIFGGIDELGAPSTAMFKAEVEYGTNFSNSRLQWQELISDRAFNPNRLVVFDSTAAADGRSDTAQMHCFQLGSRALGAAITEDVDKGIVFFDVYASADVSALAVKPVDTEAAVQKHGKKLRVDHSMNRIAKLPRSFAVSSLAEEATAKFLGEYQRAYTELYRHRRPLYLLPLNECGVPKFVCTTIRPTKLPFPDLWSLDGAVAFVANAIEYEPVENPLHPPEHLLSPQSVLAFQAGDSFDLSCLLVSILTGCGFDAYVTVGYAPTDVVQNDQTKQVCPLLEQEARQAAAPESTGTETDQDTTQSKFRVKGETTFESEFQTSMQLQESEAQAKKDAAAQAIANAEAVKARDLHLDSLKLAKDPSQRLLHAWVLVKAGARGVAQDTFIETASGRQYSPSDCPYTGIEWCWNHDNFWICMDLPEPHSDARLHPARADFDFSNSSKWEAVIPPLPELPPLPVDPDSIAADAEGGDPAAGTAVPVGGGTTGPQAATGRSLTPTQATGRSVGISTGKTGDLGGTFGETDGAVTQVTMTRDVCATVEMPESWVPRLSVPRDVLDMRVPKGTKKTVYQHSELEVFALFGEAAKFDGCLKRLSIYEDLEHQIKLEDREYFGRRKDKLNEKRRYYSSGMLKTFVEHFGPGAAYGVKELWQFFETNEAGESILTRQVSEFYVEARIDCLAHKEEIIGVKLIETYKGREDSLIYRSGTYGPAPSPDDAAMDKPQPLVKMTEKFQRNPAVSAQSDLARRVFYLSQDAIRVDYHIPEDRITHSYRVYTKTGHSHIVQSDPMLEQVDSMTQLEQFQALLAAEKECSMGIRQSEWESREFAKVRKLLNEAIVLETPYYDITRVNADEDDDEEAAVQEVAFDYLSPFMPNIAGTRGLTRDEALVVREACLKALKERLIERANIIQVRHDEEVASLAKRRANFQRDRDQLAKEAEVEYEDECERSTFKIQILEKRLKHHEEQAICKYYELDHKLRRDPRLACLLSPVN